MQNYPLPICPCPFLPSAVSLSMPHAPLLFQLREERLSGLKITCQNIFCIFLPLHRLSKHFNQPQGSSVNRFAAVDRGSARSIPRRHQGLLTYWLVKILTFILSPSSFLTSSSLLYLLHFSVRGVSPAQHFWR